MKLLSLIILLFCSLSFSQSKEERKAKLEARKNMTKSEKEKADFCNYEKNTIDEFTGDKILITKGHLLTKAGLSLVSATVKGLKINDNRYLKISLTSSNIFSLDRDDFFMIKTIDDKIIKFKYNKDVIAEGTYIESLSTTVWNASFKITLDKNTIDKLKNIEIVKVRWYTSKGYIEKEAKKKHYKNLSKVISCINEIE